VAGEGEEPNVGPSDESPDVTIRRFRDPNDPRDLGWLVLIVLDASAAIAVLLNLGTSGSLILERLDGSYEGPHVPHLSEVEVLSALRLHALGLSEKRGAKIIDDIRSMRLNRYPHTALVRCMWGSNEHVTVQGTAYVALPETLDALLVTMDARLARVPGIRATVEVYGRRRDSLKGAPRRVPYPATLPAAATPGPLRAP
jgi:predicted nucleic acid-binding protein